MIRCAAQQPGVLGVKQIHTRIFGSRIYVDMEILAEGKIPLEEGYAVAQQVHTAIEAGFPKVKHILVSVGPVQEERR